ncbi:hypothetical protein H4582DRAFT_28717 [Lactarius indigo]|nr:hypothetical protein H4582DRAFT_28717 [Lactarius indigo]
MSGHDGVTRGDGNPGFILCEASCDAPITTVNTHAGYTRICGWRRPRLRLCNCHLLICCFLYIAHIYTDTTAPKPVFRVPPKPKPLPSESLRPGGPGTSRTDIPSSPRRCPPHRTYVPRIMTKQAMTEAQLLVLKGYVTSRWDSNSPGSVRTSKCVSMSLLSNPDRSRSNCERSTNPATPSAAKRWPRACHLSLSNGYMRHTLIGSSACWRSGRNRAS